MIYEWTDYTSAYTSIVESFFDNVARRLTGCDGGFEEYYSYWIGDPAIRPGENFWAKVISHNGSPFACIAVGLKDGTVTVLEYVVDPMLRNRGYGSSALEEFLRNGRQILGVEINEAIAVIYPGNVASRCAFKKSGFVFLKAHPDGDAEYYIYKKDSAR